MLHTVFCLWLCYCGVTCAPAYTTYVQLAVIVPDDTRRLFSAHHIAPVLDVVIAQVTQQALLPSVNISVQFGDSKCNSKEAPLQAFDFYRHKEVDIFLGPICDYSLAPVARYAPYWNIPVVSPGGFAHDFGADKHKPEAEYSTLTRVGATFNSLAVSLIKITRHYKWTRIKVIYEGEGHKDVTPRFCFLAASALVFYSKEHKLDYDFHIFLPGIHDTESLLKEEVGVEYNSE